MTSSSAHDPYAFLHRLGQAQAALRLGRTASAMQLLEALATERPEDPDVQWLRGAALLDLGRPTEAVECLERLLARVPQHETARVDLARALRCAGAPDAARTAVRQVLTESPHHPLAWLAYGDILVELRQLDDARIAFERARQCDPERARIESATRALLEPDVRAAEEQFRAILRNDPGHVAALCGLAAVCLDADRALDAERLLRHALRQTAWLPLIYRGLVPALLQLGRLSEADAAAGYLQQIEPGSAQTWVTSAAVATRSMRQEAALAAYQRAAALRPGDASLLMSAGHVQKTLGLRAESETSYKAVLEADPASGEAWWSLADLKNYVFSDAEIEAMTRLITPGTKAGGQPRSAQPDRRSSRAQVHFALGRAHEQRGEHARAFEHYAIGNAMKRQAEPFDIEGFERRTARICNFFSATFLAGLAGCGDPGNAPIFIVGLPRSGSTLLEQILASHPRVTGTMELPNILNIVAQFDDVVPARDGYPESVARASPADLAALGRRYLAETSMLAAGRERFTDKLPNNFSHIGLIHLILPHATIIDARRHPMDACFSTFKQHFAEGQTFSYSLDDLGRYYRCYLSLMDHWDQVLPGKVLHVQYEAVVRDPQTQIRRLLDHCGLEFDPACLGFHTTRRAVRTASAEQVRQPIYASAVGHWRHYERELDPLRKALGDSLDRFVDG